MGAEAKPEKKFKIDLKPLEKKIETGTIEILKFEDLPKIDLSLVDLPKRPEVISKKQEKKNKD